MEQYIGIKVIMAELGKAPHKMGAHDEGTEGYKVVYPDGYESWSPKDVFEAAYRQTDNMPFGLAIEAMLQGYKVARMGWNGKNIFIELQVPDENSKMTHPYIYIDTTGLATDNEHAPKDRVPWLASQTDMLASDWMIYE